MADTCLTSVGLKRTTGSKKKIAIGVVLSALVKSHTCRITFSPGYHIFIGIDINGGTFRGNQPGTGQYSVMS